MQFEKGKSGNPGGRTKEQRDRERSLSEAIRKLSGPNCEEYVERLHQIAQTGEDKDSIAAIKLLLERSHGRAPETVQIEGDVDPRVTALLDAMKLSPHERRRRLSELEDDGDVTPPVVDDGVDDD